jgi:1-acyl-sn-glycerol-3-phosphate acyltransferase
VTTSGVVLMALLLLVLVPLWLPLTVVFDVVRARWRFPTARFGLFGLCWCWLETLGLIAATALWLTGQRSNLRLNYAVQAWWTRGIVGALSLTVGLRITVEGAQSLGTGPFIAFGRHASLADSVMSAWVLTRHSKLRPRYVLKKELLMDPCLDIVGHRLPNYFVDRAATDVSAELAGIEQMAMGLGERDVAVIFPEGSRANPEKRARALQRLRDRSPERAARLETLRYLMPPKPGGASALLAAVPTAKVLTMWHSGFDGLDTFKGILSHLGTSALRVHVKVVEHQRATVAVGEGFVAWLDTQWLEMDAAVARKIAEQTTRTTNGVLNG